MQSRKCSLSKVAHRKKHRIAHFNKKHKNNKIEDILQL